MHSILVILTFVTATNQAKEIYHNIDSVKSPSGIIRSKGFPYSYNYSETEVFNFHGRQDEKVQIIFDKFNLYPRYQNERCGIDNANSFISYKKTERSTDYERFCGNHKPLPIMSEDRDFILRYEPVVVPANDEARDQDQEIGFNATYRFVKNYGIDYNNPADDQSTYSCDFSYNSDDVLNGTFSSPNFPGMYPTHILCYYTFKGIEKYIFINFTHFNFMGSEDCTEEIEKKDILTILTSSDGNADKKIELCGNHSEPFNVTIYNRTAFIIFYHQTNLSDTELSNHEFVGFKATFLFTNETALNSRGHKIPYFVSICVCLYLLLMRRLHF